MHHRDFGRHNMPHIHVEYQGFEAVYSIPDGQLMSGELPRRQTNKVEDWIEERQEELMQNWQLAVTGQKLFRIDPLL